MAGTHSYDPGWVGQANNVQQTLLTGQQNQYFLPRQTSMQPMKQQMLQQSYDHLVHLGASGFSSGAALPYQPNPKAAVAATEHQNIQHQRLQQIAALQAEQTSETQPKVLLSSFDVMREIERQRKLQQLQREHLYGEWSQSSDLPPTVTNQPTSSSGTDGNTSSKRKRATVSVQKASGNTTKRKAKEATATNVDTASKVPTKRCKTTATAPQQKQKQAPKPRRNVAVRQQTTTQNKQLDKQLMEDKRAQQEALAAHERAQFVQQQQQQAELLAIQQEQRAAQQHVQQQQAQLLALMQQQQRAAEQRAKLLAIQQEQRVQHAQQAARLQLLQEVELAQRRQAALMQVQQTQNHKADVQQAQNMNAQVKAEQMQTAMLRLSVPKWQQAAAKIFEQMDIDEYPGWTVVDAKQRCDTVGKTLARFGYQL